MIVLAIMVLGFGLYPAPLLDIMEPSIKHLIDCNLVSKLSPEGMCS